MTKALREQGYNATKLFRETREGLEKVQSVPGIGDEAYWGTPGLHVLKGDVYLVIGVGNTDVPANLALARDLAQKAVGRL